MLDQLLDPERALQVFNAFKAQKDLGIVAPKGHILPLTTYWGANAVAVRSLTEKMDGIGANPEDELFAAGSMFYLRADAASEILGLELTEADFEAEAGQTDGTLAHAIKLCFGVAAWKVGYFMADTGAPTQPFYRFLKEYAHAKGL